MTNGERICLFHSEGRDYGNAAALLRSRFPEAHICAFVPPDHTVSPETGAAVDEVVRMERAHYSPRNVGACLRLVRRIRAHGFERFVVLFPSPQLRMLAALSGAKTPCCLGPVGQILPTERKAGAVAFPSCRRLLGGLCVYAIAWLLTRVRVAPLNGKGRQPEGGRPE